MHQDRGCRGWLWTGFLGTRIVPQYAWHGVMEDSGAFSSLASYDLRRGWFSCGSCGVKQLLANVSL